MSGKRITSELVIKAVDQYSNKMQSMQKVTGRFADKVRSEMQQLQKMRGGLQLIKDFDTLRSKAKASGLAMDAARENVRKLERRFRSAKQPTRQMYRELEKARGTADKLTASHRRNRRALDASFNGLKRAGINTADLAGEQRRLARSLGVANTAFAKQEERMRRLKAMQDRVATSRQRMDRSLATAANMSFVGNAAMGVGGRVLSSTTDVANRSGDQQAAFTSFQNLTGADDARIVKLREELQGLRGETKQSVDEMLEGLEVLVGKGMDLEAALSALPATARAAFATETSSNEMGAAGFALYDNLKVAPEELASAYDIMAKGGKEGGFELTAMARKFPEITAGARALKMEGLDSVAQLTAALQVAMKSAGSEDQAATNLSNFLGKITSPETVRKFKKMGVSVEKELQKAVDRGVSPMEHMLELIAEKTGGDALKMGELFGDKQVLDFLRAIIPNMEEYARIRDGSRGAEGVVDEDLDRRLRDFNVQKEQLKESLGNLFTLSPETLDTLTAMLERADAFVETLIEWKKEHPGFTKALFLGATALGAMAVAGGALLTVGAGVLGTMAVMRFGLSTLGAHAMFAAGDLSALGGGIDRLGRRKMRLRRPSFVGHLLDFANFRRGASTELARLESRHARSMRTLGRQRNAMMLKGAGAGILGYLAMQNVPEDPSELAEFQDANVRSIENFFRNTPGLKQLGNGYEWAYELVHGKPPPQHPAFKEPVGETPEEYKELQSWGVRPRPQMRPDGIALKNGRSLRPKLREDRAAEMIQSTLASGSLPTPAHLKELRDYAASLREEIASIQGEIDNLGQGPMTAAMAIPHQQEMDARKRDLQEVEVELADAETRSVTLTSALQILDDTEVAPEISTESIDRALEKVKQLSGRLQSMPSNGSLQTTIGPAREVVPLAGARALGGPMRAGLPYLAGERGPEPIFASRSAFVATNEQMKRMQKGSQRVRAISMAALATTALVGSPAAVAAGSPSERSTTAHVEINGGIHITAPSGISDPEGLVDLLEAKLGDRLSATFAASFSD
ncbi:phage tail tape measure protein [Planktotalea lamellibrachiae]|nr:phage tail tape measure protein [Aliiroseovarius lamellibrachiae]